MATAPVYVFNSELQSLRFRHGDVMQNTRLPGGVWGRYTGSDTRINGGAGSGYSLTQSGMETGGDTVFDLNDSRLAVGALYPIPITASAITVVAAVLSEVPAVVCMQPGLTMMVTMWMALSKSTVSGTNCAPDE